MDAWATAAIAAGSAILGVVSKLGLDSWSRVNEGRSTAAMLAAEIAATLYMIEKRGYISTIEAQIRSLKDRRDAPLIDFVQYPETLNVVYLESLNGMKLGIVGPELAALVIRFYRQLFGLIGDIKKLPGVPLSIDEKREYLEEARAIFHSTEEDGSAAVRGLTDFSKRRTISLICGTRP